MTTNIFKPILFNTEMVQAILAGRKTRTRRTTRLQKINEQPDSIGLGNVRFNGWFNFYRKTTEKGIWVMPVVKTGDILWVRETFDKVTWEFLYKSDNNSDHDFISAVNWKPSIHMPKEAARIFLKVTNVRCERLQDISEDDAIAEGIKIIEHGEAYFDYDSNGQNGSFATAKGSFSSLWQSINAKKHPWESNPWVWVYDFERIEKPENFIS